MKTKQIEAMVNRLYDSNWQNRREKKKEKLDQERMEQVRQRPLSSKEVSNMVTRLCYGAEKRAADSNRTGACKQQGICNTYAWKGWN